MSGLFSDERLKLTSPKGHNHKKSVKSKAQNWASSVLPTRAAVLV